MQNIICAVLLQQQHDLVLGIHMRLRLSVYSRLVGECYSCFTRQTWKFGEIYRAQWFAFVSQVRKYLGDALREKHIKVCPQLFKLVEVEEGDALDFTVSWIGNWNLLFQLGWSDQPHLFPRQTERRRDSSNKRFGY